MNSASHIDLSRMVPRSSAASGQVLVIDDQPHQVMQWLGRVLGPDASLVCAANPQQLRMALSEDGVDSRLPQLRPALVLVDLDLSSGVLAATMVDMLKSHESTRCATIALFTNGLGADNERDLEAVLCAYAAGSPLAAYRKEPADAAHLPQLLSAASEASMAGRVVETHQQPGARVIQPVRLRTDERVGSGGDIVGILLDPGIRPVWSTIPRAELVFAEALLEAFPGLGAGARARAGNLLGHGSLGDLVLAWFRAGASFLDSGPYLEPEAPSSRKAPPRTQRSLMLAAFANRYGRLLASPEMHAFADSHLARLPRRPAPAHRRRSRR